MVTERLTNDWYLFRILFPTLQVADDRINLAREAFVHVVINYSSYSFQKKKVLDEIVGACPEVLKQITDDQIFKCFQLLCQRAKKRNEIVSTTELTWVTKYVKDSGIQIAIEKIIYHLLLGASSHWDVMRQSFSWTISADDKLELVRQILKDQDLGSKRKLELAIEFGEPTDDFARPYFRKLLYDCHYDQAEKLGVSSENIIIEIIVENINNGYVQDAIDIAKRFLPDQKELLEEIQRIDKALDEEVPEEKVVQE